MARAKKTKRSAGATQGGRPLSASAARRGPPTKVTKLEQNVHCAFLTLKVDLQNASQILRLEVPTPGLTLTANDTPETEPLQTPQLSLQDISETASPIYNTSTGSPAIISNFDPSTLTQISATIDNESASMSNSFQDVGGVGTALKDVINDLFLIQSQVHDFHADHQQNLNSKVDDLVESLANVQALTSKDDSPNNPIHDVLIAPDIIDYVDDGRNPDIYTRDFVELVQRGNAVLNGRTKAFRDFSAILANKIKSSMPELTDEVDMIMNKAATQADVKPGHKQSNGSS